MRPNLHIATGRHVLTYEVDGWPVGVLTAERVNVGTRVWAHLEHVILFPGQPLMYLPQMLAAGLQYAWEQEAEAVSFTIRHGQPNERGLRRLAERHGFETLNGITYWLRRPE